MRPKPKAPAQRDDGAFPPKRPPALSVSRTPRARGFRCLICDLKLTDNRSVRGALANSSATTSSDAMLDNVS